MATSKAFVIGPNFDINVLVAQITQIYQARGYSISVAPLGGGVSIELSKNNSAWYNIIGMMEGLKLNLIVVNGVLTLNYTDEKWADKIIAFILGWLCCWITWVTGGIGAYNQFQLSNSLSNDVMMFASK